MADYRKLSKKALIRHLTSLQAATAPGQGSDETERLLHELQVHQIELEVQNRELREAQQALEASRDRYADLYDFAPVGYVSLDEKGVIRELNLTAAKMLGRERSRLLGMPFAVSVAKETKRQFFAHIRQAFESRDKVVAELRLRNDAGELQYIRLESACAEDVQELPETCRTALIDLTRRREMEEALTARVRQQAAVAELGQRALAGIELDALCDHAVRLVADGLQVEYAKVLELRPDGKDLHLRAGVGWREGTVGQATVGAGEDSQAGFTLLSREPVIVEDLRTEARFSGPSLLRDHRVISGISLAIPGRDKPFGVLGAHTTEKRTFSKEDINFLQAVANVLAAETERQRAETALQEAHDVLGTRVEAQTAELRRSLCDQEIVAAILRLSLRPMSLQEVLEESLVLVLSSHGLGLESQGVIFLVEDDTRELVLKVRHGVPDGLADSCARVPFGRCLCGRVAESGSMLHVDKVGHRHETIYAGMMSHGHYCVPIKSDGVVLGVLTLYVPEGHESSAVEERFVTAAADTLAGIIRRKRIEEALAETQARYEDLYDNAPDMFASVDAQTANIIQCNQTLADALGSSKEEIVGRRVFDLYHPDCLPEVQQSLGSFVETGEVRDAELQLRRTDGSKIDVSLNVTAVRDGKGNVLYSRSAWRDITERKLAEQRAREHRAQLAHVLRLSTMGEMVTGIAHEVNQPLTAIVAYTQACLHLMESGKADLDRLRDALQEVAAQGLRAGEIIRHLRDFTRRRDVTRTAVDFNKLVREAVRFVEAEAREEGICMRLELADELPRVVVDTIQVEQVVLNLLRNAMDAMEGSAAGQRALSVRTTETAAGTVELCVCDTGPGLSKEAAARIFDPFFTTKPHGMGMGLSISRSIAEAHRGRLWAEVPRREGAMFHLSLPARLTESRVEH
jgi:two-component system sensor kinase FixL